MSGPHWFDEVGDTLSVTITWPVWLLMVKSCGAAQAAVAANAAARKAPANSPFFIALLPLSGAFCLYGFYGVAMAKMGAFHLRDYAGNGPAAAAPRGPWRRRWRTS